MKIKNISKYVNIYTISVSGNVLSQTFHMEEELRLRDFKLHAQCDTFGVQESWDSNSD